MNDALEGVYWFNEEGEAVASVSVHTSVIKLEKETRINKFHKKNNEANYGKPSRKQNKTMLNSLKF